MSTIETETKTETTERTVTIRAKYFYALMKIAGEQIDPATAEVDWQFREALDPYCVDPDPSGEYSCIGRTHFACNPGSDIWVAFSDLPEATSKALRHRRKAGFGVGHDENFTPPF